VHYQLREDGEWIGNGDANALLVVTEVRPDLKLTGGLWACFRDRTTSCVKGQFSAAFCQTGIDAPVRGTEAMERPTAKQLEEHGNKPDSSARENRTRDALLQLHGEEEQ
jgi:hypothetical protein